MTDWRIAVSRSLAGGLVAGALMYIAALVSARLLGPDAFGQISFAVVIAQLLSLFVIRGLDFSAGRCVVLASSPAEVKGLVGTAYAVVAGGAVAGGVLLVVSAAVLADALGWPRLSIVGAAVLLLPVCFRALNERLLPALNMTTTLSTARPLEGIVLLAALAVMSLSIPVGSVAVLSAMVGAACLTAAILLGLVARRHLVGGFRCPAHRAMTPYAHVIFAMTLVPLPLLYGDRLAIQAILSDADLGLYVACATATQLVAAQVVALLSGVLLPYVLREGPNAIALLRRVSKWLILPASVAFLGALLLSLAVLGSSYSPPVGLVVVFAVLAAVQLGNGLLHIAVLAHPATLRTDVRLTAVRAGLFVLALLALGWSGRLSLVTVAATLLISESIQWIILWRLSGRSSARWSTVDAAGPSVW